MTDLLHARLKLLHTLSHKAKEPIELLDADVEHRGSLLECFGLLEDTHSLLWSNFIGQQISLSKEKKREATHGRNSHLEGSIALNSTKPIHEQPKSGDEKLGAAL